MAMFHGEAQQFLGYAEARLSTLAVANGQIYGNEPQCGQAAQRILALQQQHLRAAPYRRQRRRNTGNAAAAHQHVTLMARRNITPGFKNKTTHKSTAYN